MSHVDKFNSENRKGKYLTQRERYTIEILLKDKKKIPHIARCLGRNRRTIEREIKRGRVRLLNSDYSYRMQYCADIAQIDYDNKAKSKGPLLKIGHDHKLAKYIEMQIIEKKQSPDAIIGRIRQQGMEFETSICTKTLYNYIDMGVFANISNKDLLVKKHRKIRRYRKTKIALHNIRGTSIEERPYSANTREEFGHWEMDCVLGMELKMLHY